VEIARQRTILKSMPELWQQLLEGEPLRAAFGSDGELKVSELERERALAFETTSLSGRITLQQSGWGTKVEAVLSARSEQPTPEPAAAAPKEPLWWQGSRLRRLLPLPSWKDRHLAKAWRGEEQEPPPPPPPDRHRLEEAATAFFERLAGVRRRPPA
jgi:hypothetical protein